MKVKGYDIELPLLSKFPQFFNLTGEPLQLVAELIPLSVYKDGLLVGANIPLEDAVEIATAISGLLNPKAPQPDEESSS